MITTNSAPATVTWAELQEKLGLTGAVAQPRKGSMTPDFMSPGATLDQLMTTVCRDGERTAHLTQLSGMLFAKGFDFQEAVQRCSDWNARNLPPLDDEKIEATCRSIHTADQRNHPERYVELLRNVPLFDLRAGRIDLYLSTSPPQRRWLIKDLVVLGKVGGLVAPGGSSKSQWMLQLAVSVATGIPLAGHWEVGDVGGVLVLFAEDDDDEIHRRLHRIKSHLSSPGHAKDMATIQDRLYIFSSVGEDTLLTKKTRSGEVEPTVIIDRIVALAKQIADLRLIVIDPASRFRGGEENSNEDGTRFVEALEKLAQQTGATVMLAHHASKASLNNGNEASQSASRGASSLTDGLRWQMNLNRPTDGQAGTYGLPKEALGKYVVATVTKTNYSRIPEPVLLERGLDGYLAAVNATQARVRAEQDAIVAVLRVLDNEPMPISARTLEDHHSGVRRPLKMSRVRIRQVLGKAIEENYVTGGVRKKLAVTAEGKDLLKIFPCSAPPAVAPPGQIQVARKKSQ